MTDVQGVSDFTFTLINADSNKTVINKRLNESVKFEETINDCDSRKSKSKAIGNSYSQIVQDIIYILEENLLK